MSELQRSPTEDLQADPSQAAEPAKKRRATAALEPQNDSVGAGVLTSTGERRSSGKPAFTSREAELIAALHSFAREASTVRAELAQLIADGSLDPGTVKGKAIEWQRYVLFPLFETDDSDGPPIFPDSCRRAVESDPLLCSFGETLEEARKQERDLLTQKLGLKRIGIEGERMEPGQKGYHVVGTVPHPDQDRRDTVCEVISPGYLFYLDGRQYVLFDAQVRVYRHQPAAPARHSPRKTALPRSRERRRKPVTGDDAASAAAFASRQVSEAPSRRPGERAGASRRSR